MNVTYITSARSRTSACAPRGRRSARDHQLVGAGAARRRPSRPRAHRLRRADDGAGQRLVEHAPAPSGRAVLVEVRRPAAAAGPGRPRAQVDEGLLQRGEQQPRLVVGVGGEDVDAEHHVGLVELLRRLEARAVDVDRLHQLGRARNARRRRRAGRARRRAARRRGSSRGSRPARPAPAPGTARTRWPGSAGLEIAHQLDHVLREAVDAAVEVAAQRARGRHGRCPARGRGRGRCGRDRARPACRTARRSPAARGWAA